jgi:aminopeptidase N
MKKILFALFISLPVLVSAQFSEQQLKQKRSLDNPALRAANDRSDTIDILHYAISLDITDFTTKVIKGSTAIKVAPQLNGISSIRFDLLELTVDSIKRGTTVLPFSYNDTLLHVGTGTPIGIGDTVEIVVYYHGVPQSDSQWGGFYFQDPYAYNLGVGFDANPHTFGRVWFPCFDNFVERSTYSFIITTNGGKIAICNGELLSDITDGTGNRIREWLMTDPIPSYLANVSVAPYAEVHQNFNGATGPIPIILAAVPSDTTMVKNSFVNLPVALSTFEDHFGPYVWNRVGYCMVPFNAGAMEHATNISYPKATATGSLTYQTLYAHELAHHWFGDLATCRTAEDMWLNEGWAHYCEYLFEEALYGYDAYISGLRTNHEDNLHFNIVKEGPLSLAAIPHEFTYGDHVYNKGADVAHTLRSYMGDSLFFYSLKTYLQQYSFKDVSSADFRDALSAASGMDLTNFFNDWVFNPGWTHFSIDSFTVAPSGSMYAVTVYLKQKLTSAPAHYTNVPLELTFRSSSWQEMTTNVVMSGPSASFTQLLPFSPAFAAVNMYEKISDATAPEMKVIKTTGSHNFVNAKMNLTVTATTDSSFVRITHNYTAPDPFKTCCIPYRLSPNRYWTVDGLFSPGFKAKSVVFYEGRTLSFGSFYYLDHNLIDTFEDSLVLMYRSGPAAEWAVYPYYTRNSLGSNSDKRGQITIDSLQKGEYALAMKDASLGVPSYISESKTFKIFPNPGNGIVDIDLSAYSATELRDAMIRIYDMSGRQVLSVKYAGSHLQRLNASQLSNGVYNVSLLVKGKAVAHSRFVISH